MPSQKMLYIKTNGFISLPDLPVLQLLVFCERVEEKLYSQIKIFVLMVIAKSQKLTYPVGIKRNLAG